MAKKKKRRPGRPKANRPPSTRLSAQLGKAEDLMRRGRWTEADDLLETLDRAHPRQEDVLALRLAVAAQLHDFRTHQMVCARLIALRPDDPELPLLLAGSFLTTGRPALAYRTFRTWLERWPNHPDAAKAREALTFLEQSFRPHLAEIGLGGPDDWQLGAWHEEVQVHLERGEYAAARRVAEQLLRVRPEFAPALNNTAESYSREGRFAQAIDTVNRVLAFAPNNIHALANLTRYQCLAGRSAEAAETAGRLRAARPAHIDDWLKVAEALSYLGDDAGVLAAVEGTRQSTAPPGPERLAFVEHLAGVAAYRQGREADARRHWQTALRHQPGDRLARANLDDLRQPIEKRHAAWPFDLATWAPERLFRELADRVQSKPRGQSEGKLKAAVRAFLAARPEVAGLVPILLDRGDPEGRSWALRLAISADLPAMQAALRDFALGQRGPDDQRMEALRVAQEAGLLPAGTVRMWLRGQWHEILSLLFEIHDQPYRKHSAQVEELASDAHEALMAEDGRRAEQLLRQALDLEPDAPDLLNNLAASFILQGRVEEGHALIREIHARDPDYFFGTIGVARLMVREGRVEEAAALLQPLLQKQRFHTSEFTALAQAEIELQLARGEREGARTWLGLWEQTVPDHPALPEWRRRAQGGFLSRLLGR